MRVYQRKGHTNIGCDPPDYPTAQYISNHMEAYTSMFLLNLLRTFVLITSIPPPYRNT